MNKNTKILANSIFKISNGILQKEMLQSFQKSLEIFVVDLIQSQEVKEDVTELFIPSQNITVVNLKAVKQNDRVCMSGIVSGTTQLNGNGKQLVFTINQYISPLFLQIIAASPLTAGTNEIFFTVENTGEVYVKNTSGVAIAPNTLFYFSGDYFIAN